VDLAVGVTYGGQGDKHDFHNCGYSFSTIKFLLEDVGFKRVSRFDSESLPFISFRDGTVAAFSGIPISLNVEAEK
jgi:hypothetical protein